MAGPWLHIDHIGREFRRPGDGYWLNLRRRGRPHGGFIQVVLDGRLGVEMHGRLLPVPAGHALLLHSGMEASYGLPQGADGPARFEWLFIAGAGAVELFADLVQRLGPVLPDRDGAILARLRALGLAAGPEHRTDPLTAAERIHAFLAGLARLGTAGGAHTAVARLRADPLRRWDLPALARESGCTRDHLGRVFRSVTGEALTAWLLGQRIEAAERLLRTTRMAAAEIATQAGFPSAQALARAVRARNGSGPRSFRQG